MNEFEETDINVIDAEYVEEVNPNQSLQSSRRGSPSTEAFALITSQKYGNPVTNQETKKILENKPFADLSEEAADQNIIGKHEQNHDAFMQNLCTSAITFGLDPNDKSNFAKKVEELSKKYGHNKQLGESLRSYQLATEICELDKEHNPTKSQISIIPHVALTDLIFAAPVAFWWEKSGNNLLNYISNIHNGTNLSDFFQMHNRSSRSINDFNNKTDVPTLYISEVIPRALKMFDAVAILTPYHRLAAESWSKEANRTINRDPYLIGINMDSNDVFVLGRWVGSGIFPNFISMVNDTINNLAINGHLTRNIKPGSRWLKGRGPANTWGATLQHTWISEKNKVLPELCQAIIRAYNENRLFEFMRQ